MTDPSPDQIKRGQIQDGQIKESQIKDGKIQDAQITELRTAIDAIVRMFKIGDDIAAGTATKLNPSDVQTLLFIGAHDLCTGTDIAGFLGVVPTTASAIIERLVKRGLVVRNRTEANRRIVQLSLTGDGRAATAAIIREHNSHCAQMLDRLDPDERAGFVHAMTKIATGFS